MQSRLFSAIESAVNIGIGFVVAYVTGLIIFPHYGVEHHSVFEITVIFTVVSYIRQYLIRRLFNGRYLVRR